MHIQKYLDLNSSFKEEFNQKYNNISTFGKNYNKKIDKNLFLTLRLIRAGYNSKEIDNSLMTETNIDILL